MKLRNYFKNSFVFKLISIDPAVEKWNFYVDSRFLKTIGYLVKKSNDFFIRQSHYSYIIRQVAHFQKNIFSKEPIRTTGKLFLFIIVLNIFFSLVLYKHLSFFGIVFRALILISCFLFILNKADFQIIVKESILFRFFRKIS